MELVIGWSTEYAGHKFSIGVDETDFLQIMSQQGFTEEQAARVSFYTKFRLLEAMAQHLSEAESLRILVEEKARTEARSRADAALAEYTQVMQEIRAQLGTAVPDDQPGAGA